MWILVNEHVAKIPTRAHVEIAVETFRQPRSGLWSSSGSIYGHAITLFVDVALRMISSALLR